MRKFLRTFPIISWAIAANITSALLYFADINPVSGICHLIGITSAFLYVALDNLGMIILLPTYWEFFVFKSECRPDGGCYIPAFDFKYEILTFLLLDLLILYSRKCIIPAIRQRNKRLLIPRFFK